MESESEKKFRSAGLVANRRGKIREQKRRITCLII